MPATGELNAVTPVTHRCPYVLLGSAARWLGWLNGIGALVGVAFGLGVVGADVAPPDLSLPLAVFLLGVLSCGVALLCWGLAQALQGTGSAGFRWVALANWLGALAYLTGLLAFGAACWASFSLGFAVDVEPMGVLFAANATVI